MAAGGTGPGTRGRATLLVLPATATVATVLLLGLGTALGQSLGLMPLVGGPRLSVDAYRAAVAAPGLSQGVGLSLAIATAGTLLAVLVGLAVALLVSRTGPGGRVVRALAVSTVPLPHLVGAAAVGLLLSDSGVVARLVGAQPGTFPQLVGGPLWLAVVGEYAWKESAFVAIVVLGTLARQEHRLDEVAATLGAAPRQRLLRVTLPLTAPALVAGGGISFAYVLGSYEVAWLLGRSYPEPLPVLAYRLYTSVDLGVRAQALAVALITVGIALVSLLVALALLRRTVVLR